MNILPHYGLPGKVGEFKEVVHYNFANHIMTGEPVEVVDTEMQLTVTELIISHRKAEAFIKRRVQVFAVDSGLELLLSLWQEVDLYVWIGCASEVFSGQV